MNTKKFCATVLKQFSTTGNHAIALVLVFRQWFESRSYSKPCFFRRAERNKASNESEIRLCCSGTRELEQATCYNHGRKPKVPGHFACQDISLCQIFNLVVSTSEKMFGGMCENNLIGKQLTSGCPPWLENVACLSSLVMQKHQGIFPIP